MEILPLLSACPLDDLARIDVGLEGNWSPTVTTVWSRKDGLLDLSEVVKEHERFKPSLELYFSDGWIGLHCFRREDEGNLFDEDLLRSVVQNVEAALARASHGSG